MAQAGCAVVIGASGGIGGALVRALLRRPDFEVVVALSRAGFAPESRESAVRLVHGRIDLLDEASIMQAVQGPVAEAGLPPTLILVATGLLHGEGLGQPERSWRALDAEALTLAWRVNAVGPALVAKHMLPLLPRAGRSVFAALSARVGSIGDNRLGGWHAYRASKAGLNMILRNLAIELARSRLEAICLGLHPGTVDTGLSLPFQAGVPAGRLFTPEFCATSLLAVCDAALPAQSGQVLAWDGAQVPP
ncbi:SDR family NAD(P)-dependent oxidoreductase [Lichenicoccus sp.]|uniref:SDR family NAD(P)-dependent oxidoreductase n=1 Tax=Lichenicoccus sp. TaxID=2781899 RepID=UPI003D12084D